MQHWMQPCFKQFAQRLAASAARPNPLDWHWTVSIVKDAMAFSQDCYEPRQEYTAVDSLQLLLSVKLYCLAAVQNRTEKTSSDADIL